MERTLRILIADDEAPARQRLRRLLSELAGDYEVAGEAADGEQVLAACGKGDVDLVLLDIDMPGMNGLEAAGRLAELASPPTVILVTAYEEFALDAFEQGVADYLVKPVRRERLGAALERSSIPSRLQRAALVDRGPAAPPRRRQLTAHYRGGLLTVPVEEVIYLQAEHKYVNVRHQTGTILVEESLKSLEEEFADLFMRIHRNALVARRCLTGLVKDAEGGNLVSLRGCEERLPISRRHLPEVRRWLRGGTE
jgi:two-component system response regulator AlgR